jgi:nickel/cobalt transporter (NicO) family protein
VPSTAASRAPREDFLKQLLHRGEIGWQTLLIGMAVAFGLGAMHALSPGHGKTIVAAYLVGNRGTAKHALFLGAMVTFTHTFTVFALGLTTMYLYKDVLPERVFPVLGTISGLSIVWVGAVLLYKRARHLRAHVHDHHHHHGHDHGPHGHSHLPEGEITMGSLMALGASGGLVPCPSALVILLSAIALGRVTLGMLLLVGFSLGLAVVLMGIGLIVLYAKNLLPASRKTAENKAFRIIPVLSAAVIVCLGLLMTGVSLGVIQPNRFIG